MSHLKAKSVLSLRVFPFILFPLKKKRVGKFFTMTINRFLLHIITTGITIFTLLLTVFSSANASENLDSTFSSVTPPSEQRQNELTHLLKQDCGSCHGMTLKGGLGPSLLPAALADKPDHVLVGTILYGRETLAMPAWDGILKKTEIEWLVAQLKQGNFSAEKNKGNSK